MKARLFVVLGIAVVIGSTLPCALRSQEAAQSPQDPAGEPPPVPQGVEVQARGPVHEAFATPTTDPVPTKTVDKQPPKALDEMPPEDKPEGNVVWIGGYWAWDDDRKDYLWVSGIWRTVPPGKQWVAGYWREDSSHWQWVPGFWTAAAAEGAANHEVSYMPAPPAPPQMAGPGEPPTPDSFYVPGTWVWDDGRYVWRAGYWARVQTGYVWVAAHYRWTPSGYIYIPGYWDLAIARRGVLFAPVYVDATLVGPGFVYRPAYVVPETVVIDAFFVRPCFCHYYFGDYYGPVYREYGFESCVVYSRRCYDPIFVYARWEHRDNPGWVNIQVNLCMDRAAGRAPCPPRTLNVTNVTNVTNVNIVNNRTTNINNTINNTNIRNTTVNNQSGLMPFKQFAAAKQMNTVHMDPQTLASVRQQSQTVQQTAAARSRTESSMGGTPPTKPRAATLPASRIQAANAGQTSGRGGAGLSGRAGSSGGATTNHTSSALSGPGAGASATSTQNGHPNSATHLSGPPHTPALSGSGGRPPLGGNGALHPRLGTVPSGLHPPTNGTGKGLPYRPQPRPGQNRPQTHDNSTQNKDH